MQTERNQLYESCQFRLCVFAHGSGFFPHGPRPPARLRLRHLTSYLISWSITVHHTASATLGKVLGSLIQRVKCRMSRGLHTLAPSTSPQRLEFHRQDHMVNVRPENKNSYGYLSPYLTSSKRH